MRMSSQSVCAHTHTSRECNLLTSKFSHNEFNRGLKMELALKTNLDYFITHVFAYIYMKTNLKCYNFFHLKCSIVKINVRNFNYFVQVFYYFTYLFLRSPQLKRARKKHQHATQHVQDFTHTPACRSWSAALLTSLVSIADRVPSNGARSVQLCSPPSERGAFAYLPKAIAAAILPDSPLSLSRTHTHSPPNQQLAFVMSSLPRPIRTPWGLGAVCQR